jgi:perosamine synthetase
MNVPVNTPLLNGNEKKYLLECIESGWISSEGPFVTEFENKFSSYIGRKHGVAVANGSAALDIAMRAAGIKSGDEVIMPTFTIISPAASVVACGAKPVLVDCNRNTWNMDVTEVEKKITDKTKAIVIVHIYGLPVDMDPLISLAKKYKLKIIEDAAEMHGQTYKGKKCGSFGDVSIFSFYPNKHITTGEGGMILTDDNEIADKSKYYRNLCFEPGRRFVHKELGWNYRITNLQAALGLAQLEQLDFFIKRKREIGNLYAELLKDLKGISQPVISTEYSDNIFWVYGLVIEPSSGIKAEMITEELSRRKIGTRPFFWCMHEQPVFRDKGWYINETYPNSEYIARNGFYIPSGLGLKDEEIKYVAENLSDIVK